MHESTRGTDRLSFGPFVLDRTERTLERRGRETALPERSLRLLEVLVRSGGRTVSKDRLVEEAWQGAHVSDTSLTEAISRLRRALGDQARRPRYVRTVHGRGYRFIAPVRSMGRASRSANGARRRWAVASVAASMALIGVFWVGSVLVGGKREPSRSSADLATDLPAVVFDPVQDLAQVLRGFVPRTQPVRARYRLAEVTTVGAPPSKYSVPALPLNELSVDRAAGRLAFSISDGPRSDLWVLAPRRGVLKRVATGDRFSDPVWAPDGRAVAVARSRDRNFDLVFKEVDRESPARVLLEAPLDQFPESWSQDGRSLIYSERHPDSGYDLWLLRQRADASWAPSPLVQTPADESYGAISPDGRYVAFTSVSDRRSEVLVVDLETVGDPFKVSLDGGAYPFWSAAGELLHYVSDDQIWTVQTDQLGGDATPASRVSTTVAGLYLAGVASPADRIVVAMLD